MYNFFIICLRYTVFKIIMIYLFFTNKERYIHLQNRIKFDYFSCEKDKKNILVHTVSVGEAVACKTLIEYLLDLKDYNVIVSTVTTTGKEMVEKMFGNKVKHIFFPLDFNDSCKSFLNLINPSLIIIAETEIWPNFMECVHRMCIPAILVNGRISPSSYNNYYYFRRFLKRYISLFDIIAMQTEKDKERIINIGANKEKVVVLGNLKFENMLEEVDQQLFSKFSYDMAIEADKKVFIAGSTHSGEYNFVFDGFKKVYDDFEKSLMIIAPRHMKDIPEIEEMCKKYNFSYIKKTDIDNSLPNRNDVIILNTIGELQFAYGISDIAFVGGSIVDRGGHNILEASKFGIPVFYGKYMYNFEYISEECLKYKCGFMVDDSSQMANKIISFFNNPKEYMEVEKKCFEMISNNTGVLKRVISYINKYL